MVNPSADHDAPIGADAASTRYIGVNMTLEEYFRDEPFGAKKEMADYLGITATWMSLLIKNRRKPSAILSKEIEQATQGLVPAATLRPDLFA